ncbi:zinc-binding protein A33-like isoform X2 [Phyllobates terribilis]|uniref:zinc-binding protein A33-like isoform X2 n=1 Tax=Phyllobates terribilis TaxID=111132 RepID=UPI003CCAA052
MKPVPTSIRGFPFGLPLWEENKAESNFTTACSMTNREEDARVAPLQTSHQDTILRNAPKEEKEMADNSFSMACSMTNEEEDASIPPLQTSHQDNPPKEEKEMSPPCLVLQEDEGTQVFHKRTYLQEAAWKLFQDYEKKLHTTRFTGNLYRERLKESFRHLHQYLEKEKETRIAKQGDSVETSVKNLEAKVHSLLGLSTAITDFLVKLEKGEMVNETTEHLMNLQDQLKEMSKFSVPSITHISPYQVQEWRGIRHIVKPMTKTLLFNPISANPNLFVSQSLKQVRYTSFPQARYSNAFFEPGLYVLGMPGFQSGEHYWEVDVGHKTNWILGIVKNTVPLKGPHILSNNHGFLVVRKEENNVYYGCDLSILKLMVSPMRVGIFVDVFRSHIAFYNADTTELISEMSGWSFADTIFPFFCPGVPVKEEDLVPLSLC